MVFFHAEDQKSNQILFNKQMKDKFYLSKLPSPFTQCNLMVTSKCTVKDMLQFDVTFEQALKCESSK